ncbi:MAG: autotransporter domain-containing protein [Akkermansiaceae bacterium]|nr:autotransporter domain-containing protein [Akkermansiaceae bacterium]
MKIKLPTTLRAALLAALSSAFSYTVQADTPYDVYTTDVTITSSEDLGNGLLIGAPEEASAEVTANAEVTGDVVVGAGTRTTAEGETISAGSGTLTVAENITLTITGNLYAGASGQSSFPGYVESASTGGAGDGTVEIAGTVDVTEGDVLLGWSYDINGTIDVVDGGTLNVSKGSVLVGYYQLDADGKSLGDVAGSTAELNIAGTVNVAEGDLFVGNNGTVNIREGEVTVGGQLYVVGDADTTSTLNITGGTVQVEELLLGTPANEATGTSESSAEQVVVTVSGGTLKVEEDAQIVAGTLNHKDGTIEVAGDFYIGSDTVESEGTVVGDGKQDVAYISSGDASLEVSGTLFVQADVERVGDDPETGMSVGGTVTAGAIQVQSNSVFVEGGTVETDALVLEDGSVITVSDDGTLDAAATSTYGDVSIVNDNDAGTEAVVDLGEVWVGPYGESNLTISGEGNVKADALHVGESNSVFVEGGTVETDALVLEDGSVITVSDDGTLDAAATSTYGDVSIVNDNDAGTEAVVDLGEVWVGPYGESNLTISGDVVADSLHVGEKDDSSDTSSSIVTLEDGASLDVGTLYIDTTSSEKTGVVFGSEGSEKTVILEADATVITGDYRIEWGGLTDESTLGDLTVTSGTVTVGDDVRATSVSKATNEAHVVYYGNNIVIEGGTSTTSGQTHYYVGGALDIETGDTSYSTTGSYTNEGTTWILSALTVERDYTNQNEGVTRLQITGGITATGDTAMLTVSGTYTNDSTASITVDEDSGLLSGVGSSEVSGVYVAFDLTDSSVQELLGETVTFITDSNETFQLTSDQIEHVATSTIVNDGGTVSYTILTEAPKSAEFTLVTESSSEEAKNYVLITYTDASDKTWALGYHFWKDSTATTYEDPEADGSYTAGTIVFDDYTYRVYSASGTYGNESVTDVLVKNDSGVGLETVTDSEGTSYYAAAGVEVWDGTEFVEENYIVAENVSGSNSKGTAVTPTLRSDTAFVRTEDSGGAVTITAVQDAGLTLVFDESGTYTPADGTADAILGYAEGGETVDIGGTDYTTVTVDTIAIENTYKSTAGEEGIEDGSSNTSITIQDVTMHAEQALTMDEGTTLELIDSTVTIGGGTVEGGSSGLDVTYTLDDGSTVSLSGGSLQLSEIEGVAIKVTASDGDSSITFSNVTYVDDEGGSQSVSSTNIEDSAVVLTSEDGTAVLAGADGHTVNIIDSTVGGTGTLTNVALKGTAVSVGFDDASDANTSLGTLTVTGASTIDSGSTLTFYYNTGDLTDYTTIDLTGVTDSFSSEAISISLTGVAYDSATGTYTIDESTAGSLTEGSFTLGTAGYAVTLSEETEALLADGYTWSYNSSTGVLSVVVLTTYQADAQRVANTMVSAAETVRTFGRSAARPHVYSARLDGVNLWVDGMGEFMDHSSHNGRTGFEYNAGGYAVGCDTTLSDGKTVLGIAFGQMFGENKPKQGNGYFTPGKIDQDTVMFGIYGGRPFGTKSETDSVHVDFYATYGMVDCDSTRRALSNGAAATADWDEDAYGVGIAVTWVHELRENTYLAPFVALDYSYCDIDSFTESGPQPISYSDSAYQNLSLSVGVGLSRVYGLQNGQKLAPYASVAYVGDVVRRDGKVTASLASNGTVVDVDKSVSPGRSAFQVNVGMGWKITDHWSARAGYTAEFRSGATDQSVVVGANYAF